MDLCPYVYQRCLDRDICPCRDLRGEYMVRVDRAEACANKGEKLSHGAYNRITLNIACGPKTPWDKR